jgi:hypothetical protein
VTHSYTSHNSTLHNASMLLRALACAFASVPYALA